MKATSKDLKNIWIIKASIKVKKNNWKEYKKCHDWSLHYFGDEKNLPF